MGYVVFDHIPDIPAGEQYADAGVYDVEIIATIDIDKHSQRARYEMDEPFQGHRGESGDNPDSERKNHHKGLLLDVAFPQYEGLQPEIMDWLAQAVGQVWITHKIR